MRKITALLCLFVLAFATHSAAGQKDGLLRVYFLDVGQGDAEFIITPNGHTILIDGGPDDSVLSTLGRLLPFYEKEIDVVIATHPHADHISGLIHILNRYEVHHIIEARESYESGEFLAWREAVQNEKANNIEALTGTVIELGVETRLTIIHPDKSHAGVSLKNPHDANVTAVFTYQDIDILFTGDMEADIERELIREGVAIEAEILKIGHHGSKTSTSPEFLEAVNPQAAFIEVGAKNRYGLPYLGVLRRLEQFGIPYYRTDEYGTVELISDGREFQIIPSG